MKITKLTTYVVPPRWLFLKVETDEGIVGWGEPVVEGRALTVEAAVHELADYLVGKDPLLIEDHWQVMYRGGFYRGGSIHMSALAGIDQALWDIKGKAYGQPVHALLGGQVREPAAGQQQALPVGLGAAGGQDPVGRLGGGAEGAVPGAVPDPRGGPLDGAGFDEGAADALVEGVQGAVDGGDEELGEQGWYDDRAAEVRGIARLVEPDRVVEPQLRHLGEHGAGVPDRAVQVDLGDPRGRLLRGGSARRRTALALRAQVPEQVVETAAQRARIVLGVVGVEQVVERGSRHAGALLQVSERCGRDDVVPRKVRLT